MTRLPRRSAVVAFSTENVYAIAELIRRQRGGAAVVMGSLSPRTRNAQVALYQSGEVDFLVATDAIGMGLNMDVDHVAFAGLRKFDGKRTRWLHPQEVGQIAGRAGRYRTDGTFGVTGEAEEMDEDLVASVEEHLYEPVASAEWRSADLEFASLKGLLRSLAAPPTRDGLKLAEESLDETTLRQLAQDPDLERRIGPDRGKLRKLWEVCQTPDFRKTTLDEHVRLCRTVFDHLTSRNARLPEDWIAGQFASLDHVEGEMDVLAQRLAGVRTLAYAAARPDWLRDPGHWQAKCRQLEDRLSDTLHEELMARFIDRRTSALMRGLNLRDDVLAGVGADGTVTVEGHYVGRLRGLRFDLAQGSSALEDKTLRAAAQRAVVPEVARRLGALAADADEAFGLSPDGAISWNSEPAGRLSGGRPFAPKCTLYGEMGAEPARERARRRLEAFVAGEASRRLALPEGPGGRHRRRWPARTCAGRRLPPDGGGWRPRPSRGGLGGRRPQPGRAARAPPPGRPPRRLQPLPAGPADRDGGADAAGLRRGRGPALASADPHAKPAAHAGAAHSGAGLARLGGGGRAGGACRHAGGPVRPDPPGRAGSWRREARVR